MGARSCFAGWKSTEERVQELHRSMCINGANVVKGSTWLAEGLVVLLRTEGKSSKRRWLAVAKRAKFQEDGRWRFSCRTLEIVNHRRKLRCIGWEPLDNENSIRE
ncbi:uncharacterized protein LOC117601983 [Osmia lignaria lignaria]|uniref:uncharacterized protein LOC117601983 n=1 Tax=Osmia lignaria lignaria TaxID=1437193 RepID=UPI00402B1F9B